MDIEAGDCRVLVTDIASRTDDVGVALPITSRWPKLSALNRPLEKGPMPPSGHGKDQYVRSLPASRIANMVFLLRDIV